MPLSAGDKLGAYEILALLGKGGMGEVYRARDTQLKRDVALKVLPEAFALNPERMARFQREAEVLASLNHPNIAAIHGLEDSGGVRALVMELVEGESPKGPMEFDDAWHLASQIAMALEYAHERGVMHRDLKPANVKVTPDGTLKLLDFGLAKAFSNQKEPASPEQSPTLTGGATEMGVILGTAAYMAPEQAKGRLVDKRADIWSFGVVLYELLTGERLFRGEDVSDTLAQVLTKEPDWDRLPARVRPLLRECLEKDPKQRLRDIGDAKRFVKQVEPAAGLSDGPAVRGSRIAWISAGVFLIAAVLLGFLYFRRPVEEPRVLKMSVLLPEKAVLLGDIPAVSPDGRLIAFAASIDGNTSLWVRDLGSLEARALPGTDGASLPFWSPDSRFLAFFANGKLKRTDAAGGPVLNLCDAPLGRGGTWNQNDVILFVPGLASAVFRVPAAGGTPAQVTTINAEEPGHIHPWFLPDGRHFIYTAYRRDLATTPTVYAQDLDTKSRHALIPAASNVVYASGYLLFQKDLTLMAQRFDVGNLQITGDAVPVAEQVGYRAIDLRAYFSSSQNGVLAYDSSATDDAHRYSQLTWFDRAGRITGTAGPAGGLFGVTISGNGASVATSRLEPRTGVEDIWLYDLVRGTNSRLTFSQYNVAPVWSPDDTRIAFFSVYGAGYGVHQKMTNGSGPQELLERGPPVMIPMDWSKDGRYIIERTGNDAKTAAIWVLPLFGDKKPFPYLRNDANVSWARLSPNGQWLAYQSDETKRNEIYVSTFPHPAGKLQISTNGGSYPVWGRDGKELYYVAADSMMIADEVKAGPKLDAGVPKPLFRLHAAETPYAASYDVSRDGRFLIVVPVEQGGASVPINVVVNWQAGLRK